MPYASFPPSPALAPYVSHLWAQEHRTDAAVHPFPPTRVLPTGSVDLAVYYLDAFEELRGDARWRLPRVCVTGPQSTYKLYAALGRTGIVLARLRPGVAGVLFGIPAAELRDRNLDLADLLPARAVDRLSEQVATAGDLAGRVSALDAFLVEVVRARGRGSGVEAAVVWILGSGGARPVRDLVHATGLSDRLLQRRFRAEVGLNPKTLSRVVRLQAALRGRAAGWSWSRVAYAAGYQDQAHLGNDCRRLTGLAPGEVFRRRRATALGAYFNAATADTARYTETLYV